MALDPGASDLGVSLIGVALAGGRSRRMGRDKTRLPLPGQSQNLLQWTVERLSHACDRVVVADRGRGAEGFDVVADGPGKGPAAGLLGAAARFPECSLLALACDLPGVPSTLLHWLREQPGDWVVPARERGLEPLCAIYRPRALVALEQRVVRGEWSLQGLAGEPQLNVREASEPELNRFGSSERLFLNLNRPADLEVWVQQMA